MIKEEIRTIQYQDRSLSIAVKYREVAGVWVVFLHGIGCAKESFDGAFEAEPLSSYSILTFDFAGFGASDKPDDFAYTMEDHAEIARLVIEQFGPARVLLVAHSMGGTIGTLLAPNLHNLAGFINAEGNLVSEDAGIVSRRTAEQAEKEFFDHGFAAFLASLKVSDDSSSRTWAEWYGRSGKIAVHRSGSSLVEWSDSGKLLPIFNNLPKKAYMYGDRMDYSYVLPKMQGVDIFAVANSGHFMMLDNPTDTYRIIGDCLARWTA